MQEEKEDLNQNNREELLGSKELNQETPEASFAFVIETQQIMIRFADGDRILEAYIVEGLGGVETIKNIAGKLAQRTYKEFLQSFHKTMEKQKLRSIQQQMISNHLGNLLR